jgi:hypothetical protein
MVLTNKQKFNKKYGFKLDEPHSKEELVKISGVPKRILDAIFDRAVGARKTNPESVRSATTGKKVGGKSLRGKMSAEQWGFSRIYGFLVGNPKQVGEGKPDSDLYEKVKAKIKSP